MKRTALISTLLLCCFAASAFANDNLGTTRPATPPKGFGESARPHIQAGGDNFGTATVIPALPYADGGNTCAFADDYSPPCVPSSAPDVIYVFRPTTDMCIDVSLCNSNYDTELVIYQNGPGTPIACQDDSPDCGLRSHLTNVSLLAGNTYYIMVDGYNLACGDYELVVTECPPPPKCEPCPAGAIAEGEPVCSDGYVDSFNAGCNVDPPVFRILPCEPEITVCGTYGAYNGGSTRDTDWYEVTVSDPTVLTASVTGHGVTGSALAIIDATCPPALLCGSFTQTAECVENSCSVAVGPGTYRIFVASFFDTTPCGSTYTLNIGGLTCPPVPARPTTWGAVKGIYR